MSTGLYLAAALAVGAMGLTQAVCQAQARPLVTVEYQNAPLSLVVQGFASVSGRTIALGPDVGNPEITVAFQNADWRLALDLILQPLSLVAHRDVSDGIRVDKRRPLTVEWANVPLSQVLQAFATFSGRSIVMAPDVGDIEVTPALTDVDWEVAMDTILERLGRVARVGPSGVIRVERNLRAPAKRLGDALGPSN